MLWVCFWFATAWGVQDGSGVAITYYARRQHDTRGKRNGQNLMEVTVSQDARLLTIYGHNGSPIAGGKLGVPLYPVGERTIV